MIGPHRPDPARVTFRVVGSRWVTPAPPSAKAALYVTWAILTPLRAMRWTIRRLVLALALPLAVGAAFKMWLGTGPALVAAALGALLVGWTATGYAVRE